MTDTPKESELSSRQFAVKAIHEDKLNVKNPSILSKLLESYANKRVKGACKNGMTEDEILCFRSFIRSKQLSRDFNNWVIEWNK